MSDPHRPDDVAVYNENALEELAWAIEASVGEFKLFLARCNYTNLRSRLVERLRVLTSVDIRILELKASEITLFARIQVELGEELPEVLMVLGLESVGNLDELLTASNQVREEFRKHFHFPLVLWVNDEVLRKLMRLAPDFESWATTTEFLIATDELIDFLQQTAEQFFEGKLTVTLEDCREIQRACHELQRREPELNRELQAIVESLLGFTEYSNSVHQNLDQALEHYQKALELWQPRGYLTRKVRLLYFITLCYYLKAIQHSEIEHPHWQETRRYLRQCLEVFEQAKRPDLVANSIGEFGRILRRLGDWEVLQWLAEKALQWHEAENQLIELAQDYGFLAQVALAQESWHRAQELAEKALEVLADVSRIQSSSRSGVVEEHPDKSVISYALSQYQFILAQSQHHLEQPQAAIRNLESAKKIGSPEYETELYIDILCDLQQLYFEQKQYVKAFEVKLERQSIEQQYGLRAFVGAAWIQPQRQAKLLPSQGESQEEIAPEIAASGRQLDVERLIERIGRNDCKLIVIHGQSGVGKSSLVNGGLVPALKHKAIGTSDVLPTTMRVYTNWIEELGKGLVEAMVEKGIKGRDEWPFAPTYPDSVAAILEQLQQNEQCNLRTVLIFDQFEEFFFVYPDAIERRQFFEFVGECLNILSVKVILSLREDYLHYLLECDRLDSMKIIGSDILTKNVRYSLGNFSPEDAQAVIERLTARTSFQLESALISQLVRDLAGNLGEVRPIELQVVGAQLQTDKITTLARYREFGKKEELVRRYLDEVVSDCGSENKQAAELVLYLLTDEKGTRPLKTRAEIERDLQQYLTVMVPPSNLDPPQPALTRGEKKLKVPLFKGDLGGSPGLNKVRLDLVLQIFVKSGLVLLLPENPTERYQLVHDYLAAFIRQQQEPRLKELIAQLKKEREQRQKAEAERQLTQEELQRVEQTRQKLNRQVRRAMAGLILTGVMAGVIVVSVGGLATRTVEDANNKAKAADKKAKEAQEQYQVANNQVRAANAQVQAASNQVAAAQNQYKDAQTKLKDAAAKTQQAEKNRKEAEDRKKAAEQQAQQAQQQIQDANQSLKTAEEKVAQAQQQFETASKQAQTARRNAQQAKQQQQQAEAAQQQAQLALQKAEAEQQQAQTALQQAEAEQRKVEVARREAQEGTRLERAGTNALKQFEYQQIEALVVAMQAGQDLNKLVKNRPLKDYPATSPLLALQTILDTIRERNQLTGHQNTVWSASFSPDGQRIVTASKDGTAKVWDVNGNFLNELKGHQDGVTSANFSPDGQHLVTASGDKTAKVWDLKGNLVTELIGHQEFVTSASFSPDGQRIVTASDDETARVWDLNGNLLTELIGHQRSVTSASFSPDGQRIVTASRDNTARVWNIKGNLLTKLIGHQNEVTSANFSPDGQRIVTASIDKTARVWDLNGNLLAEPIGHQKYVTSANFSPDGQRIVTASWDNTARVWDFNGNLLTELIGHQSHVNSASFSPDGERIITASKDGTARVWGLKGNFVTELTGHQEGVISASFSPDGEHIVTASWDNTARVWDLKSNFVTELIGHQSYVNSASFSPDGQRIVTVSDDKTARVWDLNGNLLTELIGHQSYVSSAASFSPDGQRLVTASWDKTARVWDLNGNLVTELIGHQNNVISGSFSPDGERIVTASLDKTARVWDLNGNLLTELIGHQEGVTSTSFSPDGERIVTASLDKTARVWDLNGKLLNELVGHQRGINSTSFSPDGQRIVTASDDNTARVWDLNGKLLNELVGHQRSINSAKFSPDGERIVTASDDNTARVWNLNGNLIAELVGHQGIVRSAKFSPDGQRIVTASDDNTARVWQVENLEQLLTRGCVWLQDYLITHPDELKKLPECPQRWGKAD